MIRWRELKGPEEYSWCMQNKIPFLQNDNKYYVLEQYVENRWEIVTT